MAVTGDTPQRLPPHRPSNSLSAGPRDWPDSARRFRRWAALRWRPPALRSLLSRRASPSSRRRARCPPSTGPRTIELELALNGHLCDFRQREQGNSWYFAEIDARREAADRRRNLGAERDELSAPRAPRNRNRNQARDPHDHRAVTDHTTTPFRTSLPTTTSPLHPGTEPQKHQPNKRCPRPAASAS